MKKRHIAALFLALCCLLSACSGERVSPWDQMPWGKLPAAEQDGSLRYSSVYDGEVVTPIPFSEMEYVRPDTQAVVEGFEAVTEIVEHGGSAGAVIDAFLAALEQYNWYATMDSLAYILYCSDTVKNASYLDEYDYLEGELPLIRRALEECLVACANAAEKEALESDYFGEDALDEYVDYSVFTNAEYVRLSQQETALITEYMEAVEAPRVTVDGESYDYYALLESGEYDAWELQELYLSQSVESLGDIYIRLVKTRKQMAEVLGYESYADYAYAIEYERDYTPAQADAYLEAVKADLVPVFAEYYDSLAWYFLSYDAMDETALYRALEDTVQELGAPFTEAFDFLSEYGLYDLHYSTDKWNGSYMTYLPSYESPFVYLCPEGTDADFATFAHEFGHFTDAYLNYGTSESIDTAEVSSQGLEYLSLLHNGLSDSTNERLCKQVMFESLQCFIFQSSYADFERQVYALDDSELTVDRICNIALHLSMQYGYCYVGDEDFYSTCWTQIPHFFNAPCYVISYCVSNDAAMQLFEQEWAQTGTGVETYLKLLESNRDLPFCELLESAGMETPFAAGRTESLAVIFRTILLEE